MFNYKRIVFVPLIFTLLLAGFVLGAKDRFKTVLDFEAEQGWVTAPAVVGNDATASGGKFVESPTNSAGSVTLQFNATTAGDYVVWCRVIAATSGSDSFFVALDDETEDVFDVAPNALTPNWQWWRLNGRGGTSDVAKLNPRLLKLSAGAHELTFRAREPNTKLDRVIITNDPTFIPGQWPTGASTPTPTPTPKPTPTSIPKPTPAPVGGFYASTSGTAAGSGSLSAPWNLTTAMSHPAALKPGDTLYLRGGTYRPDPTNELDTVYFGLNGTATAPITVRPYPGERVTIDVEYILMLVGNYTNYVGLEIMCSRPDKVVDSGWSPNRPAQLMAGGKGNKLINSVLHDLISFTGFKDAVDFELYGNLMYYFGSIGNLDRPTGTTGYIQNGAGTKVIADNLMFSQFMHGLQLYGSDAASLKGVQVTGNTLVNPGILSGVAGFNIVTWVGALPAENISFVDNFAYTNMPDPGTNAVFWGAGGAPNKNLTVTGNYVIGGGPALRFGAWNPTTFTNNTVYSPHYLVHYEEKFPPGRQFNWDSNKYHHSDPLNPAVFVLAPAAFDFAGWKQATGLDRNSTYAATKPTALAVAVRPNKYERGRAHITVYNPGMQNTVTVDISNAGLTQGQGFEIRDAQNYFGPPLHTGTYQGGSVTVTLPPW